MSILNYLNEMEKVINNPKAATAERKAESNRKAVGCFPVHCPEELIHAAGMVPVGLWGGDAQLNLSKQYFPAFACSIMQSCMENVLRGTYDILDGAIIPCMCDTLICMGQNWKAAIDHIPIIPFVHPQNRKLKVGMEYLIEEYQSVKAQLEAISGREITEDAIADSIKVYNENRRVLRRFTKTAAHFPAEISPWQRHVVIASRHYMDKEAHTALVAGLVNELETLRPAEFTGKRVLLSGILADSRELSEILCQNSLAVGGDDLAQESRLFRYDVPDGDNGLERLSRYWSILEGCSLVYDPDKKRADIIRQEVKENKLDGVIFSMMKFCDPEEYDYPIIKDALDKAGIPNLYLEIDQQGEGSEQARTRIQTFAEILGEEL